MSAEVTNDRGSSRRKAERAAGERRSLAWRLHHWAGLKLSLLMSFILATGTLAVFAHEIDWLLDPAIRVPIQEGPMAGWGAWADGAGRALPGSTLTDLAAPLHPGFAVRAVIDRDGDPKTEDDLAIAYVDPWTGEPTGVSSWWNVQRILRFLHRHLMLPVDVGLPIVAALALPLLVSLVTGLVSYRRFWRGFSTMPWASVDRRPGAGRRAAGRWHRWLGLWSLPFLALMGVTGLWYLIEWGGGAAPSLPRPEIALAPAQPRGATLDRLVAAAREAAPDLEVRVIRFSGKRGLELHGQRRAVLVRDRANAVHLDPATGRVLLALDGATLSVHQRISEAADPLHFGTFGGLWIKLLWFLLGCGLTALAVTGAAVTSLRLARSSGAPSGPLARLWRAMGVAAYPAASLVALGLFLAVAVALGTLRDLV